MANRLSARCTVLAFALILAGTIAALTAQQPNAARQAANQVAIDADDMGGVVTSANGPEAGVWVIAETTELPTKFRKIVVTDQAGRFVLPDLPKAGYRVWVRGYGLVDSGTVVAAPGEHLALVATVAPDAKAAAQYYPSNYWLSLMQAPPKSVFPIILPAQPGNAAAAPTIIESQARWVATIKGCEICHQMGNKATRELSPALGTFDSSLAAWDHRIQDGPGRRSDAAAGRQSGPRAHAVDFRRLERSHRGG